MTQLFQHFFHESSAKGGRSTALYSLQWILGMLLSAIPLTIFSGGEYWVVVVIIIAFVVVLLTYIAVYLYLLFKDRDALRSEHFTLSKMAIEKGLVGDDLTGLIEDTEKTKKLLDTKVINDEEGTR